jgi:probable HAF family extracellular repeat protein
VHRSGTLGGELSRACGINGNGQIVGESQRAGGSMRAVLSESGSMTDA